MKRRAKSPTKKGARPPRSATIASPVFESKEKMFRWEEFPAAWKRVEEIYQEIGRKYDGEIRVDELELRDVGRLEQAWRQATMNEKRRGLVKRGALGRAGHPLSVLLSHAKFGAFAPPEILLYVSECFEKYLHGAGTISLEEVFFGKPKNKTGNYAGRQASEFEDLFFLAELGAEMKDNPRISMDKAAESIVPDGADPQSRLRKLRRRLRADK